MSLQEKVADLVPQAARVAPFLLGVYLVPLLFLATAALLSTVLDVPIGDFTRDPSTVARLMPYVGSVSSVGIIFWTAGATVCFFGWAVLRRRPDQRRFAAFLLHFGLVTAVLGLDDLFLLHETADHFGLDEKVLVAGYGSLLALGLVRFRDEILETDFLLLLVGVGFLGLSVSVDVVQDQLELLLGGWRILLEDGFKLLGIAGWFGYFLRCALNRVGGTADRS